MKILHLCLASFYVDNYTYQENMLPKYHKKMGLDVEIVASLVSFNENGKIRLMPNTERYINEFGIPVTRIDYKKMKINKKLRRYRDTYKHIERINPDIIFVHGCQFMDITHVVNYAKKNKNVTVFVDNHADFSNSAKNIFSKNILHKVLWRSCAKKIEPYTKKFYGVMPSRVDFLQDIYKIPKEKVELLVMGVDDEKVSLSDQNKFKIEIRNKYGIDDNDFLIVTGGKIDLAKRQTLLLIKAVKSIKDYNVKLIVFGSIVDELKNEIEELVDSNKVYYAGWLNTEESYKYFSSADLVVFPGRHSVFWEQITGMGIPLIIKYWNGTTHVDLGGNCKFLHNDSVEEIKASIEEILKNDKSEYKKMKRIAKNNESKKFLYSEIAKRSIEF
ncbi:glycosyltransferase family 4 protein [Alkalibacter rhizosphaerae]|uniref:Glycosyltransferase family 4 protein n=1 Tax=Alkalibacter rhizosphaerae TaxID=2815577 RepID=A0A974XJ08_9FIRM|nr:glycosyltransferase family 4 protein [Alkalibacter rhizosphaerae]QSX09273.1 glycosyltransferase family 4 protein [Alkalibacter rhizosphaerae]